jgi:diketogulonate reductase-like aldo/keto reductase
MYRNEQSVGATVRISGLPREEVFVTTKLMPTHANAQRAFAESLRRLGLDYVDLYLIHWPLPLVTGRQWRDLEALQEQGLARGIGVSNYGRDRLAQLLRNASRPPAVNQVQFSPFHYRQGLLDFCLEQGVVLEAYSPLARGEGLNHPTITEVAERNGRTPAQVMLRWALQHQTVVIPKSSREDRIRSNAEVFDFELTETDMHTLDQLDRTHRTTKARSR